MPQEDSFWTQASFIQEEGAIINPRHSSAWSCMQRQTAVPAKIEQQLDIASAVSIKVVAYPALSNRDPTAPPPFTCDTY